MSSKPIIKLYGEIHGHDQLLHVYDKIFALAKQEGVKNCFIERQTFFQEDKDEMMKAVSQYGSDFDKCMRNVAQYYGKNRKGRGDISGVYLGYLAVQFDMKLIHADVGRRPIRSVLRNRADWGARPSYSFQSIRDAFEKITVADLVLELGQDPKVIEAALKEVEKELHDEKLFWNREMEERELRLSDDGLVADFILSKFDNQNSIVIYGQNHIDYERPDSLSRVLAARKDIGVYAYNIVGAEIFPRPGEIRLDGSEVIVPRDNVEESPSIQNERGLAYFTNEPGAKNSVEARWWLFKAAKQGYAEAQFNLASLYGDVYGDLRNYEKAFFWAHKAADQGYMLAFRLLGELYYDKSTPRKDDAQSALWYEKAARAGDVFSQSTTGYNYLTGCGVKKDALLAYMWYFMASEKEDKNAIKNIHFAEKKLTSAEVQRARQMALDLENQLFTSNTTGV